LTNARLAAGTAVANASHQQGNILYISRTRGSRVVVNDAEVTRALLATSSLVRRVEMERLPLVEQMLLVSASSVLVGVHGQALSLMAFLPRGRFTAMVEMQPYHASIDLPRRGGYQTMAKSENRDWMEIYSRWCMTARVHHVPVQVPVDVTQPACQPMGRRKTGGGVLACNVTARVSPLVDALRTVAAKAARDKVEDGE
jgi:hypothetical protein